MELPDNVLYCTLVSTPYSASTFPAPFTFSADCDFSLVSRKLCAFFRDRLKLLILFSIGSFGGIIEEAQTASQMSPLVFQGVEGESQQVQECHGQGRGEEWGMWSARSRFLIYVTFN